MIDQKRLLLKEVAYNCHGSQERLLEFLQEHDPAAAHYVAQVPNHATSSILAFFGVHRCTGCGGDPEWLLEWRGAPCKGCAGSGWMHEMKADLGVVHTDPLFPGFGFTVKWAPGMFGKPSPGWTPKWRLPCR